MAIFEKYEHRQSYLKMGLMGQAGSGKTFTATEVAIGLVELMRQRGLNPGPVAFIDTETGSDWVAPRLAEAHIDLMVSRTRSLVDLVKGIRECSEAGASCLIIDSITHFWTVFCDEYAARRNRQRGLEFSDWAFLKKEWRRFTDEFINSPLNIIMCGRAGYEYDFFTNDAGKRELQKTGVKMKAETETGYEPSLLVLMEIEQEMNQGEVVQVYRTARIMKDRSNTIDGQTFRNPAFKAFLPHVEFLALAGAHKPVDLTRDNSELFAADGAMHRRERERREREIAIEEIEEVIKKHHAGQSKEDKEARGNLMEKHFGTRAWSRIQAMAFDDLVSGRNTLWVALEGIPYQFVAPVQAQEVLSDEIPA